MIEGHGERYKSYSETIAEKINVWVEQKRTEWIGLVRSSGLDEGDAADLERILSEIKPITRADLDRGVSQDQPMRSFRYALTDDFLRDKERSEANSAWRRQRSLSIAANLSPEKRALMEVIDLIHEDSFKQP